MKSNWISNVQTPCGIGEVVSPREVTYSVTCQEWFVHGLRVRRILPTICVHMCRVMAVSFHSAKGRDGQCSDVPFTSYRYSRLMKSENERFNFWKITRASSCVLLNAVLM